MVKLRNVFVSLALCLMVSGCSVYMAANQPDKKDMTVLAKGTDRARVIAELGAPQHSETSGGVKKDIFKFTQGYSTEAKAGRAVLHGAADVLTLGLWEVIGTPVEGYANGTVVSVEITYDTSDKVQLVRALKGAEEIVTKKPVPPKANADSGGPF